MHFLSSVVIESIQYTKVAEKHLLLISKSDLAVTKYKVVFIIYNRTALLKVCFQLKRLQI
jgi:hypothetical protein